MPAFKDISFRGLIPIVGLALTMVSPSLAAATTANQIVNSQITDVVPQSVGVSEVITDADTSAPQAAAQIEAFPTAINNQVVDVVSSSGIVCDPAFGCQGPS